MTPEQLEAHRVRFEQPVEVQLVPLTTMQPSGDQLRAIAQTARNMNGPSDTTTGCEYALAGWKAAVEEMCLRIKAADDAAADGDYMLDSDDCIRVLRGTWLHRAAHGIKPASSEGGGRDG